MTFYEKMRIVCLAIPEGNVATYGQIAVLCGKPKNSRQGRMFRPFGSSTAKEEDHEGRRI